MLRSFVELQGIIDFRAHVERQTARLESDVIYPPGLYVPQRLQYDAGAERVEVDDALAKITVWLREPRAQFVLVLGDFGAGKTFLLHELARRMPNDIPHLVPMLVELRALEKANTLEQLVAQHLALAGERYIDLDAIPYMLREGKIALLFDGFDELAQRVTYQRATEHFESLVQAAGGDAKVVVTSRTQHFESDRQVKLALLERAELVPSLSLCRLQPFDDAQIRSFLERRLDDAAEASERFKLIQDVEDLLGLSQNPRMLGFIAALPAQQLRDARERAGTMTAAELYRMLIDQWLEYEAVKIPPRGVAPTLTKQERLEAVTTMALRLWAKLERTIGLSELGTEVSAAAASLGDVPDAGALDRDNVTHLVGSRTLLVRDEEGSFAFVHQSVMEWLVADDIARELAAGNEPSALGARPMTPLMTEFLCDLSSRELLAAWARAATRVGGGAHSGTNALVLLDRLGEHVSGASFAGQDLAGSDLVERDLRGANLAGADLTEARLEGGDLRAADLRAATLVRARLDRALLGEHRSSAPTDAPRACCPRTFAGQTFVGQAYDSRGSPAR
jgi:energy-coupling factor transporter ATP-binding protein EcfA2